jgi:hypothetical protein
MPYDPERPRPGTDREPELDALLGDAGAPDSGAPDSGAADHEAESARRAVPSPAEPLDVDVRLVVAAVVAVLVVLAVIVRRVRSGD